MKIRDRGRYNVDYCTIVTEVVLIRVSSLENDKRSPIIIIIFLLAIRLNISSLEDETFTKCYRCIDLICWWTSYIKMS